MLVQSNLQAIDSRSSERDFLEQKNVCTGGFRTYINAKFFPTAYGDIKVGTINNATGRSRLSRSSVCDTRCVDDILTLDYFVNINLRDNVLKIAREWTWKISSRGRRSKMIREITGSWNEFFYIFGKKKYFVHSLDRSIICLSIKIACARQDIFRKQLAQ